MDEDESEFYEELLSVIRNWNIYEYFKIVIYLIYEWINVEWFDSEVVSCIVECGMRLFYCFIVYWLGL